ncbi:S8 family serine peptidase [Microbacterium sp. LRZ72]|uniref:S8 family serine peptidase n=1 Tax=Microbacterium sp. LRZ72 TaxID=2942481 RepID=UPI0039B0588B
MTWWAKVVSVGAGLALVMAAALPAAASTEEDEPTAPRPLSERLALLAGEIGDDPDDLAAEIGLPASGAGSLQADEDGRISVTVQYRTRPDAEALADLERLAHIRATFSFSSAVSASAFASDLAAVAALPQVVAVAVDLRAATGAHRSDAATSMPADTGVPNAVGDGCRAVPVEADGPLRSAEARERFGVDGTGVTIGIISDSFASLSSPTDPEEDVDLGVLPGPGNPCGYDTPVEVLEDGDGGDEGRAMAQLVHGIAPGARLMFSAAGESELTMIQSILNLAEAGADIIVDDISFYSELYYQPGFISWAIDQVEQQGVTYFTSIGNSTGLGEDGTPSAGRPISGWQTDAYRPMDCPAWVEIGEGEARDCLDFDPGPGQDATDTIRLSADNPLSIVLGWGEVAFGTESDFTLQFYSDGDDPELLAESARSSAVTPNGALFTPMERPAGEHQFVLVRTAGADGDPPPVWFGAIGGGGGMLEREYDRSAGGDVVGPTAYGHQADGYANAVGAAYWDDVDQTEEFSSLGPGTQLFGLIDAMEPIPSPALPDPITHHSPVLTSVDGTRTSFFGSESEGPSGPEYRFYGTSAAAPNAAAVVALAAEYDPDAASDDLLAAARGTAATMDNPLAELGFADADVFGAGLIDATAMLGVLDVPSVGGLTTTAGTDAVDVAWAALPAAASYEVRISGRGIDESVIVGADEQAHRFEGLVPETDYTVAVAARNADGRAGPATTAAVTTLRPAEPAGPGPAPAEDQLTDAARGGLVATPDPVRAGERLTLSGLPASQWMAVWFRSDATFAGWVWTGASGTAGVDVPSSLPAGEHAVAAMRTDGTVAAWAPVTVTSGSVDPSPSGRLASSGSEPVPAGALAGAALLLGSLLLIHRRRARRGA